MKTNLKRVAILLSAVILAFCLTSCAGGKSKMLGKPQKAEALSYDDRGRDNYSSIIKSAEDFALRFSAAALGNTPANGNSAVSPVSVYMALALAAECAKGGTQDEILSALGLSYEALLADFPLLYRALSVEHKIDSKTIGRVKLGNSIWLNKDTSFEAQRISSLADNFFCYSYAADFANDNRNANLAVRKFVKEQTLGLIKRDFELKPDTLFTIINTLYLKDVWNIYGNDMKFTKDEYRFTGSDGTVTSKKLLQGEYTSGRAYETDSFKSYYTATYNGYKIKFIIPKDGYSVNDVFTAENVASVKTYTAVDDVNRIKYFTRTFFPEFKAAYDNNVMSILQAEFGINSLFKEGDCNLTALTASPVYCPEIRHITDLTVDKKGIEGAAVTVMPGATSAGPGEYQKVYEDFIVDRAFGFILTDRYDVTLFTGIVNRI